MARLRYIVDRPRGPRGGHNDTGPYYTLSSAKLAAASRDEVIGYQGALVRPAKVKGTILVVDIDEMLPVDADSDREFAWHESRMQYHAGEAQRLKPGIELRTAEQFLTREDLARLRQRIEEHFAAIKGERRSWRTKAARHSQIALEEMLKALLASGKLGGPSR